jgi:hypothetical protein
MSLAEPTRTDILRLAWWAGTFVAFALYHLTIVWVFLAASYVFYQALRWAIQADRAQAGRVQPAALDEADEIAAMRKFHESLDGTIDMILRRGK